MKLKLMGRASLLVLAAAFYTGVAFGQPVPSALEDLFTSSKFPINGNVLVAENGIVVYKRSLGFADAKNKVLNNEDSRFQLASITKVFTSTAILQLRDRGKLRLDDRFARYFPDFPYPEITIRHLLSHTSGLPDFQIFEEPVKNSPDKRFTNIDIIPALTAWKKPLPFKPGEKWSYSNPGYCLLALLIEKLSTSKYEDFVRKNIFIPSRMGDSYFETDKLSTPDTKKSKEQRYPLIFDKELQPVEMPAWRQFAGNGGIISTTADLLAFDQALYSGKLLKPTTMEEAFTPAKLVDGKAAQTSTLNASYGLGWFVLDNGSDEKLVWHGGGRPGIVGVFLRNISRKQTVIVFDNSFNQETYRIGLSAMNILNGRPTVVRKKSLARDYALMLIEKGADAAMSKLVELRFDAANYILDEDEMNEVALQLLYGAKFPGNTQLALEVARLNIALFPESSNIYDTYGEILAKTGQKNLAIEMYRRSIKLDPKNESGRRALEDISKK